MSTSHQAGPAAAPYPRTVVLSMRRFRIEVDADGAPFVWTGDAVNEAAAFSCAAHDLVVRMPNVQSSRIRLMACVEVAS